MGFSPQLMLHLSRYLATQWLHRQARFPLVLMLEPTHQCNLRCAGCGKVREYQDSMDETLSVDECLSAAQQAGAPVVAVSGGEPLLYAGVAETVRGLIGQGRFVYLCTNALLLTASLDKFSPSPQFSFNVHLDGVAHTHDRLVGRAGTFHQALEGIDAAKRAGFQVCTNTTVYRDTDPSEIVSLLGILKNHAVSGVLLSPAFSYEAVDELLFLTRDEVHRCFKTILANRDGIPYYNTPPYLDFLLGRRQLPCSPWGNPTRTPQGWKQPCYLLTDGYCDSFSQLMEQTDWDRYGPGKDPRCANCMVHSGFEASSVMTMFRPKELLRAALWSLSP
jgi:hopanoid biosynthesis associated radical SAM protein HpnH